MTPATMSEWRSRLTEGSSGRTVLLVAVLLVLMWAYGLSKIGEAASAERDARDRAARLYERVSAQSEAADWEARAARAAEAETLWRAKLWPGGTPGVAAARVQGQVERSARSLGLENVRVSVSDTGQQEGGAALLLGRVNAVDPGGLLPEFLAQLAASEPALVLTGFEYARVTRGFRVEFLALAPGPEAMAEPAFGDEPAIRPEPDFSATDFDEEIRP